MTEILPVVSIACITYNHENYLSQCIEGFLMQKTNFPIEIIIHEDASTDKSAIILKEYSDKHPDLIFPIFQVENKFSKGINPGFEFVFPKCRGKYIALCEGDDYWTDPYKLQKQVDFLEANDDYSICSHRYKILHQESGKIESDNNSSVVNNINNGFSFDLNIFFQGWYLHVLSVVFRKNALDYDFLKKVKYPSDYMLFYSILKNGKGYLFGFEGAVYRKHQGGIYTSNSTLNQAYVMYDCLKDLIKIDNNKLIKSMFNYRIFIYIKTYIRYSNNISISFLYKLIKEYNLTIDKVELNYSFLRMLIKSFIRRYLNLIYK